MTAFDENASSTHRVNLARSGLHVLEILDRSAGELTSFVEIWRHQECQREKTSTKHIFRIWLHQRRTRRRDHDRIDDEILHTILFYLVRNNIDHAGGQKHSRLSRIR